MSENLWQTNIKRKDSINNLKNNQSVVTKPCDKGGGICIMNIRDYLIKIHTHLQDHNTRKSLTHNPTSAIVNYVCTFIECMHFQHIIEKAIKEFLLPPKNTPHLSSMDCPKFTSQTALSALFFLYVVVQLTISLLPSTISSNL